MTTLRFRPGYYNKSGSGALGRAYRNLNTWRSFRAPPVSVATVDRSRAPLHVHSMDNDARMIRLPSTSICASLGNAGPSDALGGRGNRIHAGRSPPPSQSPVRNRFPQGRWTDYAGSAEGVNKSGTKILLAGFYAIDPQQFFLRTSRDGGGFCPHGHATGARRSPSPVNGGGSGLHRPAAPGRISSHRLRFSTEEPGSPLILTRLRGRGTMRSMVEGA
jgi:hypothetical protein